MRTNWKNWWEKWLFRWKHCLLETLGQRCRQSLGFIICMAAIIVFFTSMITSGYWARRQNDQYMEEIMNMISTYLATATKNEYEEIAQTIRHDVVYSQYGKNIENLIQYIPNTAVSCCLKQRGYPERVFLVFLNTGESFGLDIYDKSASPVTSKHSRGTILTC